MRRPPSSLAEQRQQQQATAAMQQQSAARCRLRLPAGRDRVDLQRMRNVLVNRPDLFARRPRPDGPPRRWPAGAVPARMRTVMLMCGRSHGGPGAARHVLARRLLDDAGASARAAGSALRKRATARSPTRTPSAPKARHRCAASTLRRRSPSTNRRRRRNAPSVTPSEAKADRQGAHEGRGAGPARRCRPEEGAGEGPRALRAGQARSGIRPWTRAPSCIEKPATIEQMQKADGDSAKREAEVARACPG